MHSPVFHIKLRFLSWYATSSFRNLSPVVFIWIWCIWNDAKRDRRYNGRSKMHEFVMTHLSPYGIAKTLPLCLCLCVRVWVCKMMECRSAGVMTTMNQLGAGCHGVSTVYACRWSWSGDGAESLHKVRVSGLDTKTQPLEFCISQSLSFAREFWASSY